MADAAAEMARRGYRVIVFTSRRGYEDPRQVYRKREVLQGVDVRRLPWSSFGKRTIAIRILGALVFLLQVICRALLIRRLDGVLVSTSPPIGSLAALVIGALRRVPITYWAMDINPDQAVALGACPAGSIRVRLFNLLNRLILRHARRVVTLDRFMAERLSHKFPIESKLAVMPPWPHEDVLPATAPVEENPFRWQHGLAGKFVFMYSGNLSIAHPLDTILFTALRLQDRHEILFLFVGGGLGKQKVQQFIDRYHPTNVRLLPYQPLDWLRYSLSAADVHLVSMGNNMVGIVHPCKVYGAMACGKPLLLVGPRNCHVGELLERFAIGWQINHGDVDGAVALFQRVCDLGGEELRAMGCRGRQAISTELSKAVLCGRFCDEIEATLPLQVRATLPKAALASPGETTVSASCDGHSSEPSEPATAS
jgi:glycosyltransferase involved in cell wall biosynthesis